MSVNPHYKKPKTIRPSGRRRYAYRNGKMVDITDERQEESQVPWIGGTFGKGWNGR
jgi:hypothetical protein